MLLRRKFMFSKRKIYFSKLNKKAKLPNKLDENAGYDIFACFGENFIKIEPNETKLIPTGIAWACDKSFYMQIEERSSTGVKGIKRSAGVIDSGYRGEIKIAIYNGNNYPIYISNISEENLLKAEKIKGDYLFYSTNKAIAQGIIHRVEKMQVEEIAYEDLLKISSQRKEKGFGSTNGAVST
jgi:dUTP pyrophosphatase